MTSDRSICLPVFLLVICISRTFVLGEQQFLEKPQPYQEVSSGDDVKLRCIVQNKGGQCIWQKDRRPVGIQPDKYEWANTRGSGDCTLMIRRVNLYFDDGFWECQVTSSDFTRQDALSSEQSRLLVKVKPKEPQLEYEGSVLGATLTLQEGQEVMISCVSKYGNPPAVIKWFIGNKEEKSYTSQSNATEVDNPKTWAAHSFLRVRGRRENHGLPIRCVAMHPTSLTPMSTETRLDIHYSPEVRLEMGPQPLMTAPEDSVSFLNLKCLADANPVPSIKWFKDSVPLDRLLIDATSSPSPSLTQGKMTELNDTVWSAKLHFEPVTRNDAGLYSCKATNNVGESAPASYRLDVQYGPKEKSKDGNVTSASVEEMALLSSALAPFECSEFEANPSPQYRWVHLRGSLAEPIKNRVQNKGGGRRLHLENIMWSDDGDYRCLAFNTINGVKRETSSNTRYVLHVTGPPEIQTKEPLPGKNHIVESVGWVGEAVHRLKFRFCSQPPPKLVAWQWGSSLLRAGENIKPKYDALPLEPIVEDKTVTNCYWAKLEIKNLRKEDARIYILVVESEKGRDSTNINLIVKDPTEMRVIAAAVAVGLLFLLLLISISVYSLLRMRRGRYRQKVEEEGSIAADALYSNGASMDQQKSINSSHAKTFARKSSLDGSQGVYDYSCIAKQTRAMSPEALKVRRAPAVLQPPTIV